jgi:hypothetical protein
MPEYDVDSSGIVLTKPLMSWSISHVAGGAVLLTIRYANTPDELEQGHSNPITFVLAPQAGLDMADALHIQAQNLLDGTLPNELNVH